MSFFLNLHSSALLVSSKCDCIRRLKRSVCNMTRSASRSGSAGGYDVEGITWRRRRIQIVIMPTVREGQCDDTKKDLIEYEFFTRHPLEHDEFCSRGAHLDCCRIKVIRLLFHLFNRKKQFDPSLSMQSPIVCPP